MPCFTTIITAAELTGMDHGRLASESVGNIQERHNGRPDIICLQLPITFCWLLVQQ
jgi:hypothetical protein